MQSQKYSELVEFGGTVIELSYSTRFFVDRPIVGFLTDYNELCCLSITSLHYPV